jgi:dTDP-4-amino-4,6-dideoxygalactose transaminase
MYRIGKEEISEIQKLIESGDIFRSTSKLQEANNFEREWAEKVGTRYSLLVSGGTGALICALVGLGIGPGDEVIVPGYTFMASALAVLAVGAIPVICEVDDSLTMDPDDMESKISRHTKAVMPVHLVGFPCDMDKIMRIAKKHNLKVVEDSCQADGGSYKDKRLGSIGDVGAFSFNFYKIISAGEGGGLTTDDRDVYERALIYHDGGIAFRKYASDLRNPVFIGTQFRISEILAAVLRVQLGRIDGILYDLRKNKKMLMEILEGEKNVEFARSNDIEGDCGIHIPFRFASEEKARKFAGTEGLTGFIPIDSDKHVYENWTPILEKRGGHHESLDPFKMKENQGRNMNYSKDMCPQTLDYLKRTYLLNTNPEWTGEEIEKMAAKCKDALEKL